MGLRPWQHRSTAAEPEAYGEAGHRRTAQCAATRGLAQTIGAAVNGRARINAQPRKRRARINALLQKVCAIRCAAARPQGQNVGLGARRCDRTGANMRCRHEWTRQKRVAALKGSVPGLAAPNPIRRRHQQQISHAPWPIHLSFYPTIEEPTRFLLRSIQREGVASS